MDGLPATEELVKALFLPAEGDDNDDNDDEEERDPDAPDRRTVPEFVFALTASDEGVIDRVLQLPEAEVANTKNAATREWECTAVGCADGLCCYPGAEFQARLAKYRAQNTDETTVLNYFDFHEIHPVDIGTPRWHVLRWRNLPSSAVGSSRI